MAITRRRFLGFASCAAAGWLVGCREPAVAAFRATDVKDFPFGEETLVAFLRDGSVWTSRARGIRPLLQMIDAAAGRFAGACSYDRIVGRAAAFLYVKLGVAEVRAGVMSEGAAALLARHGIRTQCVQRVRAIRNRRNDGICPMDAAVKDIPDDAIEPALAALRAIVARMS